MCCPKYKAGFITNLWDSKTLRLKTKAAAALVLMTPFQAVVTDWIAGTVMKDALNFPSSARLDGFYDFSGSNLPSFLWTFCLDTVEAGNHMSDNFMLDDSNIRHGSQRGYTLESFNSQWSRGPLNQYGVLEQNGCAPWLPCQSHCNLIWP